MPDADWYTADSGHDAIQRLVNSVSAVKHTAIDTETTGLDYMRDIPLYWSISWREGEMPRRSCLRADVLPYFRDIFRNADREWIFANAKYDTHILYNFGIRFAGKLVDTQVMHALLYEEQPHGLKEMTESLLGWRWKSFQETFGKIDRKDPQSIQNMLREAERSNLAALVEYASNDAYGTYECYLRLKRELEEARTWSLYPDTYGTLWDYFYKLEVPFTKVLWKCERNGCFVDLPYLKNIEGPVAKELIEIERAVNKAAGFPLNPKSTLQLRKYFFEVKGYRPLKFTKGGASGVKSPSVDYDYLDEMKDKDPVADLLLRHRDLSKLQGTYVQGIQGALDNNGRVHTHFNQDIARTGRLSSSAINLQNIPKPESDKFKIRRAFIPEPGNTLIVADYEQLEMRLLAAAAMERDMIQIFLDGKDIHMGNAEMVFGIPYEDLVLAKKIDKKVKEGQADDSEYSKKLGGGHTVLECLDARNAIKAIGFGLNYGMKENKLASNIRCSVPEAKALIRRYMDRYPTVERFYATSIDSVRKTGYAFTLLGRRRFLPEIVSDRQDERWRAERQASNVPIQGTAADVVKMAMLRCDEENLLDRFGFHMLIQVHDELMFEGPEETVQEAMPVIRELMEHSLPEDLKVPLTVSMGKGHSWIDAK